MPCARRGYRSGAKQPEESLSWAAPGTDKQEVPCPVYPAGAQQQATTKISVARLRQWVRGKARKNRLRQLAKRQGLRLSKSRRCDARTLGPTCYGLAAVGSGRLVSFVEGMTLDEVENYLVYGMANAKVIEYLSQTYGSVFIGDLIKHLPKDVPSQI
ncbi:hypothetical protein [Pseudomonas sp.]|uniref:hypothetical protein n=1 Tax=Pseudomonas sp. TaxID=306 RepID=UPI002B46A347|nr:hypothetical protein [Pseudomonas sp.]